MSTLQQKLEQLLKAAKELNKEDRNKPKWPAASGGKQDHPEHAPFPSNDHKPGDTFGMGTSSDKPSMATGEPRIHKLTAKQSGHGDAKPARSPNNEQWSLDKADKKPKKPAPVNTGCTGNSDTCQCPNCRQNR